MAAIFNLKVSGPPPGNASTGADQWIDLGVIPTGKRIWLGNGVYTSPDKSITFEVRTNTTGKSASGDANTSLIASTAVSPRSGTLSSDYYRKGRLHLTTVYGTGTERFWLRLKSKSGTLGSYLFTINYTTE